MRTLCCSLVRNQGARMGSLELSCRSTSALNVSSSRLVLARWLCSTCMKLAMLFSSRGLPVVEVASVSAVCPEASDHSSGPGRLCGWLTAVGGSRVVVPAQK